MQNTKSTPFEISSKFVVPFEGNKIPRYLRYPKRRLVLQLTPLQIVIVPHNGYKLGVTQHKHYNGVPSDGSAHFRRTHVRLPRAGWLHLQFIFSVSAVSSDEISDDIMTMAIPHKS